MNKYFNCLLNTSENLISQLSEKELEPLKSNQVLIKMSYSCVNFKDALAVTNKGKILKHFPLTPGIDGVGIIVESLSDSFKIGNVVMFNGTGFGEIYNGGFSEYVVADANNIFKKPSGLSDKDCMTLGTAGFTAALALNRMEINGQDPSLGPIVVTGASGGVGRCAIQILNKNKYEVWAISQKIDTHEELIKMGASKVFTFEQLNLGSRPLERVKWGGAIDNLGGINLAKLISHTEQWGNVVSVGLADSPILNTTVMPFILRGVNLLGASSANCKMNLRKELWQKLSESWKPEQMHSIVKTELQLKDVVTYSQKLIERKVTGRALVKF